MDSNTFMPPAIELPAIPVPPKAGSQKESEISSTMGDGVHQLFQKSAKHHVHSITTRPVLSDNVSIPSTLFPNASLRISNIQPSVGGYGKGAESKEFEELKSTIKDNVALWAKKDLTSSAELKRDAQELKSATIITETQKRSELATDDKYQGKSNEPSRKLEDESMRGGETRIGQNMVETPTKSSMKADIKTPQRHDAEAAASCFFPIVPPYTYSAYGFHPIQPFMANPMTPQGGPIVYSSFGQAYYSPTPYSDMYAMYPMMQQYATTALETPTRPSASSQTVEDGEEVSQMEFYGLSPQSVKKIDGNGKEEAA